MRYLDAYLERPDVLNVITRCRQSEAVQGVMVEVDPYWLLIWRLGERKDPDNPLTGFQKQEDWFSRLIHMPHWQTLFGELISEPWQPVRSPTADELGSLSKFKWWSEYCGQRGLSDFNWPVFLRICLYPRTQDDNRTIPRFDDQALNITYEVRPLARLATGHTAKHRPLVGGISIGIRFRHTRRDRQRLER